MVIAEAALEKIPPELRNHNSVINHSKRLKKRPDELLLDINYHYEAMVKRNIPFWWKRGRPDIVHFDLMESTSTPLFISGRLNVFISTFDNKLLTINKQIRIPKSYTRFEGVIINLFKDKIISHQKTSNLLELKENIDLDYLVKKIIRPDVLIGFSTNGAFEKLPTIISRFNDISKHYCFVVGGFQKGHFMEKTSKVFDYTYCINEYGLESHVVIARILYEIENQFELM